MADEKAGEGVKFEEFKGSAGRDNVPELPSPACVDVPGEMMAFRWRRWSGIGVGLVVVVVREVVKAWTVLSEQEWKEIPYLEVL